MTIKAIGFNKPDNLKSLAYFKELVLSEETAGNETNN